MQAPAQQPQITPQVANAGQLGMRPPLVQAAVQQPPVATQVANAGQQMNLRSAQWQQPVPSTLGNTGVPIPADNELIRWRNAQADLAERQRQADAASQREILQRERDMNRAIAYGTEMPPPRPQPSLGARMETLLSASRAPDDMVLGLGANGMPIVSTSGRLANGFYGSGLMRGLTPGVPAENPRLPFDEQRAAEVRQRLGISENPFSQEDAMRVKQEREGRQRTLDIMRGRNPNMTPEQRADTRAMQRQVTDNMRKVEAENRQQKVTGAASMRKAARDLRLEGAPPGMAAYIANRISDGADRGTAAAEWMAMAGNRAANDALTRRARQDIAEQEFEVRRQEAQARQGQVDLQGQVIEANAAESQIILAQGELQRAQADLANTEDPAEQRRLQNYIAMLNQRIAGLLNVPRERYIMPPNQGPASTAPDSSGSWGGSPSTWGGYFYGA